MKIAYLAFVITLTVTQCQEQINKLLKENRELLMACVITIPDEQPHLPNETELNKCIREKDALEKIIQTCAPKGEI